jgi:tetratricopeptide (TPR) repeat protein
VQGVIASRIDRLPREDKTLLQLASAVGTRVSPQLLTAVTGMPMAQLQSRLWSLEIVDFLVESRWLASVEYEFAHDLIREVAFGSILRAHRGELHDRILQAMEASALGREEEVAEALCQHAVKAKDWVKADRYGHMAARKAFARSAFRDATEYFEIAMDAVDKQPESAAREQRAIDLRIESRLVFGPFGKIKEWFGLGREAEIRSDKIQDEKRRLASIATRAAALNFYGTPYEGLAAGQEAFELADRLANETWRGFVEFGLGQSHFLAGRFREAERWLERAILHFANTPENVPPGTTSSSLLVLCHMMKSIAHVWMGEFETAERHAEDARGLAHAKGRPYDIIVASYAYGVLEQWRGNLPKAEKDLGEALRLAEDNEVRQFLPLARASLANVYMQKGDAVGAEGLLLRAKEEAEVIGHQSSMVVIPAYLGSAYVRLGDSSRGLALARGCRAGAKQKGYGGIEALAALVEADCLAARRAGSEEAVDCLKQVVELASTLEARPLLGHAREALGRLLAASGREAEAKEQLFQAIALFDRSKMTTQLESAKGVLSKF